MKEKDFQIRFGRWVVYRFPENAAHELKICHEKSLPFTAVKPHQIDWLTAISTTGAYYKIPDDSIGQKPCDSIFIKGHAVVCVMFYTHGCNGFYMFPIATWVNEMQTSERKSLTEERAKEIGAYHEFK